MAGRRVSIAGFACLLVTLALPAAAHAVTEFPLPTAVSQPAGITVGPDGALWFTEENGHKIGRITTAGHITEYPIPTVPSAPSEITTGPDGALWFTESAANPPRSAASRPRACSSSIALALGHRPRRDHGRARRGAVVHRERRQQDRPDHDRRPHHHRLRPSDRGQARRHHDRPGRAAVVHRVRGATRSARSRWRATSREYDLPLGTDPSGHRHFRRRALVHPVHGADRSAGCRPRAPRSTSSGPPASAPPGSPSGPTARSGSPRPAPTRSAG